MMVKAVKINPSAHAWGEPISTIFNDYIQYRKLKREQIISVSFPDVNTCIIVFEEDENDDHHVD